MTGPSASGPAANAAPRVMLVTATGRPVGRWSGAVMAPGILAGPPSKVGPDDFLLLCQPGVELLDGAEAAIDEMLVHDPDIDLAYFDGITTPAGADAISSLRPGFSPDRLRQQQYLGPAILVRGRVFHDHRAAGDRLDLQPDTRQLDRLAGRCSAIAHLPRLLYRTPGPDPAPAPDPDLDPDLGQAADAIAFPDASGSFPLVSVIMPTRGGSREIDGETTILCLQAIDRLAERTTYRPVEIVVVLTPGSPDGLMPRLLAALDRHPVDRRPTLRFTEDERPFNFSNACNRGAVAARGEVLVFLNDDTAIVTGDWLERLVARAVDPEVGAVGARLLYGDGSIQHAGIWSRGGHPAHRYEGFRADHPGHLGALTVAQNCLAVTGACLAVETSKFHRAGGFCPEFPSSYNDVDLCLKLDALGHRSVVDPNVVITHYEASTRDPTIEDWEFELLNRRWRRKLIADPNDNPNHLAPGVEEFPPPDPVVTLERQRAGRYGQPARVWRRTEPVADLIDLERAVTTDRSRSRTAADEERHVV